MSDYWFVTYYKDGQEVLKASLLPSPATLNDLLVIAIDMGATRIIATVFDDERHASEEYKIDHGAREVRTPSGDLVNVNGGWL